MKVFETRLRGIHAKTVEDIMSRTVSAPKINKLNKSPGQKGDNITTYLRKFEIDRENLNLAKRILLCDSEHNHNKYKREWKKTQKFMRVRSNFKRNICNQEPRIFKYQPILGFGKILVSLEFDKIQSNLINFREGNTYTIQILLKKQMITKSNNQFTLDTFHGQSIAFYIPKFLKNKKIWCYINELKENNIYEKGKFYFKPSHTGYNQISIFNKNHKHIGSIHFTLNLRTPQQMSKISLLNLSNSINKNNQNQLSGKEKAYTNKSPQQILCNTKEELQCQQSKNQKKSSHLRNRTTVQPISSLR